MSFSISSKDKTASRRQFGHVLLAGAVGVALTACGGGSDPTGVTDDDSTKNEPDLKKAYDRIVKGMVRADVIEVVGVRPNDVDGENASLWVYSKASLEVRYFGASNEDGFTVANVIYKPSNGVLLSKSFES
jgi:hypothetical protein